MIHVDNLCKDYGRNRVLDGVSFSVEPGELLLVLGGNGAGKSTLLRCLLGLVSYRGAITVAGLDPLRQGRAARRRMGYMPQGSALHLDLTVAQTLRFHRELRRAPREACDRLLRDVDLEGKADARVSDLSGGMKQRLQFALALLDDPPVLLLDEPTASLDDWSRDFLTSRVRRLTDAGKSVLLSTHARDELLGIADRAILLRAGVAEALDLRHGCGLYGPRASGAGDADGEPAVLR
ncbi:MAG TPA: ABC transporter ATP-binding protein [Thermoanaerobaculia bacterium]|nr:ABC transporter ATP-binding protein [Thermoanaerobaculia bacterium]